MPHHSNCSRITSNSAFVCPTPNQIVLPFCSSLDGKTEPLLSAPIQSISQALFDELEKETTQNQDGLHIAERQTSSYEYTSVIQFRALSNSDHQLCFKLSNGTSYPSITIPHDAVRVCTEDFTAWRTRGSSGEELITIAFRHQAEGKVLRGSSQLPFDTSTAKLSGMPEVHHKVSDITKTAEAVLPTVQEIGTGTQPQERASGLENDSSSNSKSTPLIEPSENMGPPAPPTLTLPSVEQKRNDPEVPIVADSATQDPDAPKESPSPAAPSAELLSKEPLEPLPHPTEIIATTETPKDTRKEPETQSSAPEQPNQKTESQAEKEKRVVEGDMNPSLTPWVHPQNTTLQVQKQVEALDVSKYSSYQQALLKEVENYFDSGGWQGAIETRKFVHNEKADGLTYSTYYLRHSSDSTWSADPRMKIQVYRTKGEGDVIRWATTNKRETASNYTPIGGGTRGNLRNRWVDTVAGWKVQNQILDDLEYLEQRLKEKWASFNKE